MSDSKYKTTSIGKTEREGFESLRPDTEAVGLEYRRHLNKAANSKF